MSNQNTQYKNQKTANYDRGIVSAETAARIEREEQDYKEQPAQKGDIDTTSGYTVDREGLANNFAIEPEMYVNEPGDLRHREIEDTAQRKEEIKEVNNTNEQGKLEMANDERGKGTGII